MDNKRCVKKFCHTTNIHCVYVSRNQFWLFDTNRFKQYGAIINKSFPYSHTIVLLIYVVAELLILVYLLRRKDFIL